MKLGIKLKKKWIVIGIILIIVGFIGVNVAKGAKPMEVATVAVTTENIESTVSAAGIVSEDSNKSVYAEVPVKVRRVLIEKNEAVKEGEKILDLDLSTLNSQLKQAKISLDIQKINRDKLLITSNNSDASTVQIQNALQLAKQTYDQSLQLFQEGAISQLELDNAKKAYDNAKASYDLGSQGKGNDLKTTQKQIELTGIQISDLTRQIKQLQESAYSPIDGVVSELNVVDGSIANSAVPMYKVIDNSQLEIKANIKEFTIKDVRIGQRVYITGDAFDGITYNGVVKYISPIAFQKQGMQGGETFIEVIISVTDKDTLLKSGLNVTCDIVTKEKSNVPTIPLSSFMEDKDSSKYVYIIENGVLKKVKIQVGINSEDRLEITSGIKDGTQVLKEISSYFKEGLKVKPKK